MCALKTKQKDLEVLNLTPHDVVVETDNGRITFEPSSIVANVSTHTKVIDTLDNGIPVIERSCEVQCYDLTKMGEVKNIPELPCEPFLVSPAVLHQLPKEYSGVAFAPDTDLGAIRDDKGYIVATSQLVTIKRDTH